jgi:hypothetical protein
MDSFLQTVGLGQGHLREKKVNSAPQGIQHLTGRVQDAVQSCCV